LKKSKHIYIQAYITSFAGEGWEMPLTRKARIVGSSLVLTIPSQLAKAHDINDGDEIEIIPTGISEFKIRKVKK
jgi:competence protein ComGF